MNEAETRAEHIDPALKVAGWGPVIGAETELLGKLIDRVADSGLTVGRALQRTLRGWRLPSSQGLSARRLMRTTRRDHPVYTPMYTSAPHSPDPSNHALAGP